MRRHWVTWYDRHSQVVYAFAWRLLAGNQAFAEQVLQGVFLHVWRKASHHDASMGTTLTWLLTLTRDLGLSHLPASSGADAALDEDDESYRLAPGGGGRLEPGAATGLNLLCADERRAIEMAYFQGFTPTEISRRLQAPVETIRDRIKRGMLHLREVLGPQFQQPDQSGNRSDNTYGS